MIRPAKFLSLSVLIGLISLLITLPALAIPPLPSSFYGTLKVNGANVPDGTLVQALINGQVFATGYTQTYQGASVYALNIPGDDTDTTLQDGGRENDPIKFEIGGALADQTGTWKSATNVNLNLTATVVGEIAAPQATPSPVPTQTAIRQMQGSPTPTQTPGGLIQPSPTSTQTTSVRIKSSPTPTQTLGAQIQSSPNPTQTPGEQIKSSPVPTPTLNGQIQPSPIPSQEPGGLLPASATPSSPLQPSPTAISPLSSANGSSNAKLAVAVGIIVIVAAGSAFFALRRRMDIARKSRGSK